MLSWAINSFHETCWRFDLLTITSSVHLCCRIKSLYCMHVYHLILANSKALMTLAEILLKLRWVNKLDQHGSHVLGCSTGWRCGKIKDGNKISRFLGGWSGPVDKAVGAYSTKFFWEFPLACCCSATDKGKELLCGTRFEMVWVVRVLQSSNGPLSLLTYVQLNGIK